MEKKELVKNVTKDVSITEKQSEDVIDSFFRCLEKLDIVEFEFENGEFVIKEMDNE